MFGKTSQFPFVPVNKLRALDQIQRQVTAEAKFGKDSQIGALALGTLSEFQNLGGISGEVTDSGIELRESNFHGLTIGYGPRERIATSSRQFTREGQKKWANASTRNGPLAKATETLENRGVLKR